MRAASRASAIVAATFAISAIATFPSSAETADRSPTSVELTRLVKLNLDNRPLAVAVSEIRRLVSQAGAPRPRTALR
jgi:hypothetical protein